VILVDDHDLLGDGSIELSYPRPQHRPIGAGGELVIGADVAHCADVLDDPLPAFAADFDAQRRSAGLRGLRDSGLLPTRPRPEVMVPVPRGQLELR
jgi:hypothetical protein